MKPVVATEPVPHLPQYGGACVSNIVPALTEHHAIGQGWIPDAALDADQVVVLLVDGMGWNQLVERKDLAPTLAAADGQPITTVAPTTTATALTSFTTGSPPGEHGVVGYRIRIDDETLNVLRWSTEKGDARERIVPTDVQVMAPFGGRSTVVVSKAEFVRSGFTMAHLEGVEYRGYEALSTFEWEVERAATEGHRLVYAYYDSLDRVGHERGHGEEFDAEFAFVDRMVARLRSNLAPEVALLVTADHGQVDSTNRVVPLDADVMRYTRAHSGEARFVWLHGAPGMRTQLLEAAQQCHGHDAWVCSVDQIIDEGWFGPRLSNDAAARLGDVALVSRTAAAFADPAAPVSMLRGRHGSLTVDELYVPLLAV